MYILANVFRVGVATVDFIYNVGAATPKHYFISGVAKHLRKG
jgi:hypothetical protein